MARQDNLYAVSDADSFCRQINFMITKRDVIMKCVIFQSLLHLYARHSNFDFIVARHICNCVYFKQHNQRTLFILCRCPFYNTAVGAVPLG